MFGYVKVFKPELKIREYETYRGVYCTLCCTLGREYGVGARMLLSYDAAFYVLLLSCADSKTEPEFQKGRCPFRPAKVCHYQCGNTELYAQAAALTVILSYHKVRDDLQDGGFLKKSEARILYPYLSRKYKKARAKYPVFADIAEEAMRRQAQTEQENCPSTDLAADPSAKALEKFCAVGRAEDTQTAVLKRTAYCVGRFVYLIDAYDDLKADLKYKSYNPFIQKYGLQTAADLQDEQLHASILQSLYLTANEAVLSFHLLDGKVYRSILENILCDGLESQIERVKQSYREEQTTDV